MANQVLTELRREVMQLLDKLEARMAVEQHPVVKKRLRVVWRALNDLFRVLLILD